MMGQSRQEIDHQLIKHHNPDFFKGMNKVPQQPEHMEFKERSSKKVVLHIHPEVEFREVLNVLDAIKLPGFVLNGDNIKFAVLELLNNSLRAHREKNVKRKICTVFLADDTRLRVSVKDYGGGFDPACLPYDLTEAAQSVDHSSARFQKYQQQNNYLRFGMGLLVAKRTFNEFRLSFFNDEEKPVSWGSGAVFGTLIDCATDEANAG